MEIRSLGQRRGRGLQWAGVALGSAALIAGSISVPVAASADVLPPADTVFINGQVMQFADNAVGAKFSPALTVKDGEIAFIGDNATARRSIGENTKVIDLGGRLLMPGMGDGHLHGPGADLCNLEWEGGTIDSVLGKIKACLERPDQADLLQTNYVLEVDNLMGEAMQPRTAYLTRQALDRLSKDPSEDEFGTGTTRPIKVNHMDSHKFYTNSKAIENAGVTRDTVVTGSTYIGYDEAGEPDGRFSDYRTFNPGDPAPMADDELKQEMARDIAYLNSFGITMAHIPMGGDPADAKELADEGKLTMHLNLGLMGGGAATAAIPGAVSGNLPRFAGIRAEYDGYTDAASPGDLAINTVKIVCDGVPEFPGQTAAMLQPYNVNNGTAEDPDWAPGTKDGDPSCGAAAQLGFSAYDQAGWNIHVHAIGDRATRFALDRFETALAANTERTSTRRHTITHLEFIDESDIPRFQELDITANMSLQWAQRDAFTVDGIEGYVNYDTKNRLYPAGELLDAGATISAGSDWSVNPYNPWRQVQNAVTREGEPDALRGIYAGRQSPRQAISLVEAIRTMTSGVAYQLDQESVTGSLEVGKLADLIVTDQNVFDVPAADIAGTNVLLTMIKGVDVYQAEGSPLEVAVGPGTAVRSTTLRPDAAAVKYRGTATIDVLDNDGRGGEPALDAGSLAMANGAASQTVKGGVFTAAEGKLSFTAAPRFAGTVQAFYRVENADGKIATQRVTVSVGKAKPTLRLAAAAGARRGTATLAVSLRLPDTAKAATDTRVAVYDGKRLVKSKLIIKDGAATLKLSGLSKRTHAFSVVYAGTSVYTGARATKSVRVR